jgi:hypothetical protein
MLKDDVMPSDFDEAVSEFDSRLRDNNLDADIFLSNQSIFRTVLDEKLYLDRMNKVLKSVLDRTAQTNLYLITGTFVSLHSSNCSNWIVIGHGQKSEFLYMTPIHSLQSPISGSGYVIDRYKLIGEMPFDRVQSDATIQFVGKDIIDPYAIAAKSGNGEIIDIIDGESARKSFSLRVSSNPTNAFQINFDRKTMRTFGITPVDPMSSNLTTIFDLLADISSPKSVEYLVPFSDHDLHFVRWRAIRTVFSIDEGIGLDLIERACGDPHEHVRSAANETLRRISA